MSGVCVQCARRSWLLAELSVQLDFRARDLSRFWDLLELPDLELIEAIGGRRKVELQTEYEDWKPESRLGADMQTICRHRQAFPASLRNMNLAPHMLGVRGEVRRLEEMLGETVVAIVGTRRATDYGMETARVLARGLAASGVTIASGLGEGIARAVHTGALEAHGSTLTVMAGSLERCSPAGCDGLYRRIISRGCAISETPLSVRTSRWCEPARARTLGLLAQLVIVVEADERPWELACARVAHRLGRTVAAVPGRVSSPASKGANSLLMGGARLVRNSQDALDLLYGVDTHREPEHSFELEPRLRTVFEQVSSGLDTIPKLTARGWGSADVSLALAELELQELLLLGNGGRYLPAAETSRR